MSFFEGQLPQPLPQKRITPFHSDTQALDIDITTLWSLNTAMYQYIEQLHTYLADQEELRILQETAITELQEQVALLNAEVFP